MSWLNAIKEIFAVVLKGAAAIFLYVTGKKDQQLKDAKAREKSQEAQNENDMEFERRRRDESRRDWLLRRIRAARGDVEE